MLFLICVIKLPSMKLLNTAAVNDTYSYALILISVQQETCSQISFVKST